MLVATAVLGVGYTALVTGVGQLALPGQANGSTVVSNGTVVGSSLIGQSFTKKDGSPLPDWFQSRPSAAGDGYDAGASSASNYGPDDKTLASSIAKRRKAVAAFDGVPESAVPADAVTASASGLDPDISPEYALLQVKRVASARGLSETVVHTLVESAVRGRAAGYLGEPTVNVLELNAALAKVAGSSD
jgi:K+-transporting ATPase ATPase C chain